MTVRATTKQASGAQRTLSRDGATLIVRLPFRLQLRGGRKLMLAPDGTQAWFNPRRRIDTTLVKAIARAHRWKRMLEDGDYASVTELAEAEGVNQSYMCRMLRLTLLAPDIVEAILNGKASRHFTLERALQPMPVNWVEQLQKL